MYCRRILIFALTGLSLIACGESADTLPGQPIAHRRAAFKKLLLAFEPMGTQLQKHQYNSVQFIDQAKALSSLKNEPWRYFGVDTNYPPTHAKAKVRSAPAQFKSDQQAFLLAVEQLVLVAEDRDETHVVAAYGTVQERCRNCHKDFRD